MKSNIYTEIESILIALKGSQWSKEPIINTVIQEYERLVIASKRIRHIEHKSALQILFSSRAIDTLLEFVINKERVKVGLPPVNRLTIGQAINRIKPLIDPSIADELEDNVRDKRNDYLHQAGIFPTKKEMEAFLHTTAIGINEIIVKIP